ncbi:MAG: sigma-54 dependent transcriptional regulator [Acidobacteriota bacterium]
MAGKRILIVDDEKRQREILELILSEENYPVSTASSAEQALRMVKQERFDLVLTDLKMGGMDGLQLLNQLVHFDSSIIVILMTAHGSIDSVKEAIKLGAFDYLEKPLEKDKLIEIIRNALERLNLLDSEIIGQSEEMERVKKMILKVARSQETVLIRGESGVGKELIARAIHNNSARASQLFSAVNCAAINENLLESELFGHEKGSFTGAHAEKKGLFEVADRGTLFLDEIGDLNISMQAKILRALQEREIMRVGGTKPIKVDVRVLAATNRDLEAMVKEKTFRSDLYYRLNVIPINIPPLRNRRDDIPVLIDYFLAKHGRSSTRPVKGLTPAARKLCLEYPWPGNVRQLESAIKRAVLLCEGDYIDVEDLPVEIRQGSEQVSNFNFKLPPEGISFEDLERSLIIQAMEQSDWNITRAAKLLGLTFRTLQYRLEKFNIQRPGRGKDNDLPDE